MHVRGLALGCQAARGLSVSTQVPAGPARSPRAAFGPGRKPGTPCWRRRRPCGQGRSWSRPSGRLAAICWRSGCRTTSRLGCGPPRTPTTRSTPGPMWCPGRATSSCSGSPPRTSAASTAPSSPTPAATARAWPPRRCATSMPCCTGPSETPSASATWSATWPMRSPRRGAPLPRCRSGPHSSCAPS
jgi:hypothetical protein